MQQVDSCPIRMCEHFQFAAALKIGRHWTELLMYRPVANGTRSGSPLHRSHAPLSRFHSPRSDRSILDP